MVTAEAGQRRASCEELPAAVQVAVQAVRAVPELAGPLSTWSSCLSESGRG